MNAMKKYWYLQLMLLIPVVGFGQNLKDGTNLTEREDIKYVSVRYKLGALDTKINVNYGEGVSSALDEEGKPVKAKLDVITMNYMKTHGWELFSIYQEVDEIVSKSVMGKTLSYNTVMIFKRP